MKISTKVLIILVLVYNCSPAQQETDEFETKGMYNGKVWETLILQEKNLYLTGVEEGIALAHNFSGFSFKIEELTVKGFRMSDLASEIDLFYEQRANIRIPISYAYRYVIKKIKGITINELDEYNVWLRKIFNE